MENQYVWGTSWRPKNSASVDPTYVGQTVERLASISEDGTCSPGSLVEEARPESSPLHPLFEWDDSVAGELWRKQEARSVIKAVVLKSPETEKPISAPAFLNVKKPASSEKKQSQGYVPLATVLSDEDLHRQALASALASVRSLQKRYEALSELSPVWEALDKVVADLGIED